MNLEESKKSCFKINNLPNTLTIIRFLLAILIIVFLLISINLDETKFLINYANSNNTFIFQIDLYAIIAFILFVIATITDFVDGYFARKYNLVSDFGKLFDPIADKFLTYGVLIIFTVNLRIPIIITIIIICRDLFVDGLRMLNALKGEAMLVDKFGKIKTILLFISLMLLFWIYPHTENNYQYQIWGGINYWTLIPIYFATIMTTISGFIYYKKNWRKGKNERK